MFIMTPDTNPSLSPVYGVHGISPACTPEGLVILHVVNSSGSGRILLQGAQLLEWTPSSQAPLLWLSPCARIRPGASPRGGVPICWPWFGAHPDDTRLPAHGIARAANWELTGATHEDDAHCLTFRLPLSPGNGTAWSLDTPVEVCYRLGAEVEITLTTHNATAAPVSFTEALHTYFRVGDVRQIRIEGLENTRYIDKVAGGHMHTQTGDIRITGETDRVYMDTGSACRIIDNPLERCIKIEKQGSLSTIVWNPWHEKAQKLGDFCPDGHLDMVCVESGNALQNRFTVAPGESHRLQVRYSLENLP